MNREELREPGQEIKNARALSPKSTCRKVASEVEGMKNVDRDDVGRREREDYNRFLDERRSLNDARFRVAESLDKALLTLSGGALAISMTFIKDIANSPVWAWALMTAWVLFGSAIAVLLLSSYICQLAYKKQRQILDDGQTAKLEKQDKDAQTRSRTPEKKNVWTVSTEVGNLAALVLFLLGIAFLGIFIWINMQNRSGDDNGQKTTNTKTSNTKTTETKTSPSSGTPRTARTARFASSTSSASATVSVQGTLGLNGQKSAS